tara:strand:- start:246 stop:449 length:204 start_codon:yes stop_codon:yes gene_type:complete
MTDEDKKIVKDYQDLIKRKGWNTFDSPEGVAWFGGKTHRALTDYLPAGLLEETNFEDLDFLVIGWAK